MFVRRNAAILLLSALVLSLIACSGQKPAPPSNNAAALFARIAATEPPADVDSALFRELQAELIKVLQQRGISKFTSTPPTGAANVVTDLMTVDAGGGGAELTWTYVCAGDYDLNGEVNVADLTPVGRFFKARSGDANWPEASVADGDGNGEVNAADITPIGFNFLVSVKGYQVCASPDLADYPADPDDLDGAGTKDIGEVALSLASTNATGRKVFTHTVAAHVVGDAYWVRPLDQGDNAGARSIRSELGASPGTLSMEVDPTSLNQPTGGNGSPANPYEVERLKFYQLQLVHSVDGDVTSHQDVTYQSSDAAVSVNDTGYMGIGGLAGDFTITGSYAGLSSVLEFQAEGATGQVTFGMHPTTPPLSGTGTQADPYEVDTAGNFAVQVVDTSQPLDVTDQSILNPSVAQVQVDVVGLLVIDLGFAGDFSVSASFDGNPTLPETLYFTATVPNQAPVAAYDIVSGDSGPAPLDTEFNAGISYDPDGTIVKYEWDVDHDGTYDYSSPAALMQFSYTQGTDMDAPALRVTDNQGATSVYTNIQQIHITSQSVWEVHAASTRGLHDCAIADIDGVPNIVTSGYAAPDDHYVDYLRGSDSLGTTFAKHEGLDANSDYIWRDTVALGSYFTKEYLAYISEDVSVVPTGTIMRFLMCNNSDGSDWPTAAYSVVQGVTFWALSLEVLNAGINCYYIDNANALVARRLTDSGGGWSTEDVTVEGSLSVNPDFDFSYLNYPMVAFAVYGTGNVYFRMADDVEGTSWPGSAHLVNSQVEAVSVCLGTANGVPCMAYVDTTDMGGLNSSTPVYFIYASDPQGSSWQMPIWVADPHWDIERNIDMCLIKTKPALVYWDADSGQVMYQRANDHQGSWWWEPHAISGSVDARNVCMCEVAFNPNVAYNLTADNGNTSDGTVHCVQQH